MLRVRILVTHDYQGVTYTAGKIATVPDEIAYSMIELNNATDRIGAVNYVSKEI